MLRGPAGCRGEVKGGARRAGDTSGGTQPAPAARQCRCVKWMSLVQVITRTRNDVEAYYKLNSTKPNKHMA